MCLFFQRRDPLREIRELDGLMVSGYLFSVWHGKGRMPCSGAAPVTSHVKMFLFQMALNCLFFLLKRV